MYIMKLLLRNILQILNLFQLHKNFKHDNNNDIINCLLFKNYIITYHRRNVVHVIQILFQTITLDIL